MKNLNILFNFVFCSVFFVLISISYSNKAFDRITGLAQFAKNVYSERSDYKINNLVISDRLLFSSMNYHLRDSGLTFYMPYKEGSKITNHFIITSALKKNMSEDFILIGFPDEINYLENNYILKKKNTPKYNFTNKELNIYEVTFD